MRYKILKVYEEDYGCEGVYENSEPMCNVLIVDEYGNEKCTKISDRFLIENRLEEGDYIELLN